MCFLYISEDLSTRTILLNNLSSPASQMCNPSGIAGDNCESSMRFQLEDINFIEYEEFHPEKQQSTTKTPQNFESIIDKIDYYEESTPVTQQDADNQEQAINQQPQQNEVPSATERSEKSFPAQRHSHKKFVFVLPDTEAAHRNSANSNAIDSRGSDSKKCKRDYGEMPLKESQSRNDSVNTSVYLQENSKGIN